MVLPDVQSLRSSELLVTHWLGAVGNEEKTDDVESDDRPVCRSARGLERVIDL